MKIGIVGGNSQVSTELCLIFSSWNIEVIPIVRSQWAASFLKYNGFECRIGDINNDPLLKGKSTISNDEKTIINKAVFSTCNTENKKCRGWELQSDKFTHNKKKQLFEYNDSWLKVFDKKVFYIPYFSHPDPSVKRKSGFLTPF